MNYLGDIESIILDLEVDLQELAYQLNERIQCSCTSSELLLSFVSFLLQIQHEVKPEIGDRIIELVRFCNLTGLYPIASIG